MFTAKQTLISTQNINSFIPFRSVVIIIDSAAHPTYPNSKWQLAVTWDSTHLDSFNHEANVSDAHEVCGLVNGVNSLHMAGNL